MYVYMCVCLYISHIYYRFQKFKKYEISHFSIGGWCLRISITDLQIQTVNIFI